MEPSNKYRSNLGPPDPSGPAVLARGGRADHSQILGLIAGFLVEPGVLAAVKAGGAGMSREGRRYLLRLEFKASDLESRFTLLRSALQSTDVVVASIAATEIHRVEPSRRLQLAELACVSGFASIRAAGLREATNLGEKLPAALLEDLCLDSNAFVRSLAMKSMTAAREGLLERARGVFLSGVSGRRRAVAFDVMCTLAPECAELVARAACSDPAAAVRRAAFATLLAATAGLDRDGLIRRILEDASAAVREIAIVHIKRGDSPPQLDWLKALLTRRPASLNSLVRASIHLPPWIRLEFLLGALLEVQLDARSVGRLQFDLQAWDRDIRRCFVTPSALTAYSLRPLWTSARDRVEAILRASISAQLSAFGVLDKSAWNRAAGFCRRRLRARSRPHCGIRAIHRKLRQRTCREYSTPKSSTRNPPLSTRTRLPIGAFGIDGVGPKRWCAGACLTLLQPSAGRDAAGGSCLRFHDENGRHVDVAS